MVKNILLAAVLASSMLNAFDYGKAMGAIKTDEAIKAASKGTDVTMTDITNSVDTAKLAGAVMGSSEGSKAQDKVEKVKNAKDTQKTMQNIQTGMAVAKSLGY